MYILVIFFIFSRLIHEKTLLGVGENIAAFLNVYKVYLGKELGQVNSGSSHEQLIGDRLRFRHRMPNSCIYSISSRSMVAKTPFNNALEISFFPDSAEIVEFQFGL